MSETRLPPGTRPGDLQGEKESADYVRTMFSRIAPRYDFLNHFLSLNLDKQWRRRAAEAFLPSLKAPEGRALDLCCGTGDMALELARAGNAGVIGSDFSHAMLVLAQEKRTASPVRWIEADALNLPFPDGKFDLVTSAFGFRNLANYEQGLREIHRVLKPGGAVGILDFALPRSGLFATVYGIYFRRVLPLIGRIVSGVGGPYSYLPASVEKFPDCEEMRGLLVGAGFERAGYELWTLGTVAFYRGVKASSW